MKSACLLFITVAACGEVDHSYRDAAPETDSSTPIDAAPDAPHDACATITWYPDCDGDGIASLAAQGVDACAQPAPSACGGGWVTTLPAAGAADCNDMRIDVKPGATEVCDGVDNDCDGPIDEDGLSTFFLDSDGDGHGNAASSMTTCMAPASYVVVGDDCNDASNVVYPGRAEACDGLDNNCNSVTDEGVQTVYYRDVDGDGHGNATATAMGCFAPSGYVASMDDCNDNHNGVFPGNGEGCDGVDNNCNSQVDEGVQTTFYTDGDGDGFGNIFAPVQACARPSTASTSFNDCNDANSTIHPNANEYCFNNTDDNCNGVQDEAAQCSIECNWTGARWLSAGYDGGAMAAVGAWATCESGKLSYMQSQGTPPVTATVTGTGTDFVDCNWGSSTRWLSQGFDGTAAFTHGTQLECNGLRVTRLNWGQNALLGQTPAPTNGHQLGCNWTGAIYLSHGIDGSCAFSNGIDVTCSNGHITGMRNWQGGSCTSQRN